MRGVRDRLEVNTDLIEIGRKDMNWNIRGQGKMKRRLDEKLTDSLTELNVFQIL